MNINTQHLAHLARIHSSRITDALVESITSILSFVEKLSDAQAITAQHAHKNVYRQDEVNNFSFSKDILIKNFPKIKDGYLVVPQILKK